MKDRRWLSVFFVGLSLVLVALGGLGIRAAVTPGTSSADFYIPPNTSLVQYGYHIPATVFPGAVVVGAWAVYHHDSVRVFVMDEATFEKVYFGGITDSTAVLFAKEGTSGNFSVQVATASVIQVVFIHSLGSVRLNVSGHVWLAIEGTDRSGVVFGALELVGGATAAAMAYFFWEKPRARGRLATVRLDLCPVCAATPPPGASQCPDCGASLRVRRDLGQSSSSESNQGGA